jgi:hypothetical protein
LFKNCFFITKCASLVQNCPRYRANVNNPLTYELDKCGSDTITFLSTLDYGYKKFHSKGPTSPEFMKALMSGSMSFGLKPFVRLTFG